MSGNSNTDIQRCTFSTNRVFVDGGVVHLSQSTATIFGSFFSSSFASSAGGVLTALDGSLQMDNNTLVNNMAYRGGVVHASTSTSTITVGTNVHFTSNEADKGGGMSLQCSKFYDDELDGSFTPYYVNFTSNQAILGGGQYIDDESEETACSNNHYSGEFSSVSGCFFQNVSRGLMINFVEIYANLKTLMVVVISTESF